jgi:hypothetical protein
MPPKLVQNEWRRIQSRLRRQGVEATCQHVLNLIQTGPYPVALTTRLVELLLKRGEYGAAGGIIKAVDRTGAAHPLMDQLHSSWLWCIGKHGSAISFALRRARFWKRSYLIHHVGTLYRCMANRTGSHYYRRKSQHYWRLGAALAEQELSLGKNVAAEKKRGIRGRSII